MKDTAIRTVINPDGSIEPQHKWLCQNAYRYHQILSSILEGDPFTNRQNEKSSK